jgi:cyclic pyranopterin phosphate synthase
LELIDKSGRIIDYLRLSVIDRCNLNCLYCRPTKGEKAPLPDRTLMSFEEIEESVRFLTEMGIRKIRITGGEPLIRKNLCYLVNLLSKIEGVEDLSLTTNGTSLPVLAKELEKAGLKRINISLDSLDPETYRVITGGGELRPVLEGIEESLAAGLVPLKINTVLMRSKNLGELNRFVALTLDRPIDVRFIELMPLSMRDSSYKEEFVTSEEAISVIRGKSDLVPDEEVRTRGPASYFRIPGAKGKVGFISPVTKPFCSTCNRVRLTSRGRLRSCLLRTGEIDLKRLMRSHYLGREEIKKVVTSWISFKHSRHAGMEEVINNRPVEMSEIGG